MAQPAQQTSPTPGHRNQISYWLVRWLLFFLICLGLGYASVQRYDPRQTPGLSDAAIYFRMVPGEDVRAREMRFRVLVPWIARPFYAAAAKFVDQSRAIALALLISNSIFCAATACLLLAIALRINASPATALLAATLYLLNFSIVNLQLAGMVDAAEACFMLALVLTMLGRRWWLLPLWGFVGTLAKETFLPLASVLVLAWWYFDQRRRSSSLRTLLPVICVIALGSLTMLGLRYAMRAGPLLTDALLPTHASGSWGRFSGIVASPTPWYAFIWLLPVGVLRLRRLPRAWIWAAGCSALVALALGVFRDIGGNVARPLFDVLGPLLSLSAALYLGESDRVVAVQPLDSN